MPRAYRLKILSSKPSKWVWPLAISCGSKLPARSRGTEIPISPSSVRIVFELVPWECQNFCVRDLCEGGFSFPSIESEASAAWSATLLGRAERSSPKAAQRRAAGAGLDGEGVCQAIIDVAAMSASVFIVRFPESVRRTEWRTGPWQPSTRSLAASAGRHS